MRVKICLLFLMLSACTWVNAQNDIRNRIAQIATKLSKEDVLHLGAAVGYAGIPETSNKFYKLYQKLQRRATNDELFILSGHSSKVIVVYAFTILRSRNDARLDDIYKRYSPDTSQVWEASGCTGVIWQVNEYMTTTLKSRR